MPYTAYYHSPLGAIRITSTDGAITELKFVDEPSTLDIASRPSPAIFMPGTTSADQSQSLAISMPEATSTPDTASASQSLSFAQTPKTPTPTPETPATPPIILDTFRWLDLYFAGQRPDFTPPYRLLDATPFRARVHALIARIPYGETTTYHDLAAQLSSTMSAQAVGGAVGWNPICLLVPCHRVLGADRNLTGYAGGIERKLRLLTIEHHDPASFTFPKPRPQQQKADSIPQSKADTKTDSTPRSTAGLKITSRPHPQDSENLPTTDHSPASPTIIQTLSKPTIDTPRCRWLNLNNPAYVAYHDYEWAVPDFDDHHLFECIVLESFQAGLSWECVLSKREGFRAAYDGFDLDKVCAYDDAKIAAMARDPHIIRNPIKIAATVGNARVFRAIREEFGTFYRYLCTFTGGRLIYEVGLTKSALSDRISADLQRRGMKFTGSTIVYSYLQATGVIQSHDPECFLYKDPAKYNPPHFEL